MRTPAPAGDRPLSQLLRAWRSRKRLSLREVAAEAGVSAGYVQQLEAGFDPRSGRPIQPSPTVLQRIAAALGAPYEALMAAAGYLPETSALSRSDGHRTSLPPEVLDELQDIIAEVTLEVLRRRGLA